MPTPRRARTRPFLLVDWGYGVVRVDAPPLAPAQADALAPLLTTAARQAELAARASR